MTKTSKKTTKKEKTEVTPQTLEIEKEASVIMEDTTNPDVAVIEETPTAEANEETVMDETLVTTEIVTPVAEEPTTENPEEEMVETTEGEICPEEEMVETTEEEETSITDDEPTPEASEETAEEIQEEKIVEEPIAEEVKETPKAPKPHKLSRRFTYYWNGISY